MEAREVNLREFITAGRRTFSIPVYQRNYEWREAQCKKLFSDIKAVALAEDKDHFLGTIVYVTSANTNATWSEFIVIDGQQRITTIMILLKALYDTTEEQRIRDEIWEDFLTNKRAEEEKYRLKLKPIDSDAHVWNKIIDNDSQVNASSYIWQNYDSFKKMISGSGISPKDLLEAVGKLGIVYIQLTAGKENPQVIFESINSTGIGLSQGDLIRNYLLMNCDAQEQERLYKTYWLKMESLLTPKVVADFMRDYLLMINAKALRRDDVYEAFKRHAEEKFKGQEEELLEELRRYAEYYSWFRFCQSGDKEIDGLLKQFHEMGSFAAFASLLWFFNKCFHEKALSQEELIRCIKILISYQYRRLICRESTNALNHAYLTLTRDIDSNMDIINRDIVDELLSVLVAKTKSQIFPRNEEFRAAFAKFDIYNSRFSKYTLVLLENVLSPTEKVDVTAEITIEHIMPQKLTAEWRISLGKDHEQTHANLLHTIGNLTLTGHNGTLGNQPYSVKQKIYRDSNIALTRAIAKFDDWDGESIKKRTKILAEMALQIWELPAEYNRQLDDIDGDHDRMYSFAEDVYVRGKSQKPIFFILFDTEVSVNSWTGMFEKMLNMLHDHDPYYFEIFMKDDIVIKRKLCVPKDRKKELSRPAKIAKEYFVETNFSANQILSFLQIILEIYGTKEEAWFRLKKK